MSLHASPQAIPHRPDESAAVAGGRRPTSLNLRVGGIVCPQCPPTIEKALRAVPGVTAASRAASRARRSRSQEERVARRTAVAAPVIK